jgi:L-rhamnose isomerase
LDGGKLVDRDAFERAKHFQSWIDWCADLGLGLDFNPTCFSHPLACRRLHADPRRTRQVRQFWVEHGIAHPPRSAPRSAASSAEDVRDQRLDTGCIEGHARSIGQRPAGAARRGAGRGLRAEAQPPAQPGFAIESEALRHRRRELHVGSHEFYLGYAVSRNQKLLTASTPVTSTRPNPSPTSSPRCCCYVPETCSCTSAAACAGTATTSSPSTMNCKRHLRRKSSGADTSTGCYIGLDYFDASINRVAAWVIGTRNMSKALLLALVAPIGKLKQAELEGDYTSRLALMEDAKLLPAGAVWDQFCLQQGVPVGDAWLAEVKRYEKDVLSLR